MATKSSGRHGLMWAVIGGVVLVACVVAIIIGATMSGSPRANPSGTTPAATVPSTSPSGTAGPAVDASVAEKGWVPEPITADAAAYIRAALAAASTFDTQRSSREEWLAYLDTWFTPDTRYTSPDDQQADMQAAKLELRQGVVLPQAEWDSLAGESGRVVATISSDVVFVPVSQDPAGDMRIGTADVTLTSIRSDGAGGETSYEDRVRVSVQVLCGPESVPTPGSAQRAGDCKVVRFFSSPQEP